MSLKGVIDTYVNALPEAEQYPLKKALYEVMDNFRLGDERRAQNAQWYQVTSTTAPVANTEFSFAHGLGFAPKWILPVLDLQAVNAQIVPVQVSRAADAARVYLKSSSTSAVFTVFVE